MDTASKSTPEQIMRRDVLLKKSYLAVLLVLPVLIGGIVGYGARAIEMTYSVSAQESRHVAEILRIRDEYGERARDSRESLKLAAKATTEAAEAAREAAQQLKAMAEELGPEQTRAARRASDASKRSLEAQSKAEQAARVAQESELRVGRIMSPAEPHRRQEPR